MALAAAAKMAADARPMVRTGRLTPHHPSFHTSTRHQHPHDRGR